ncbi:unnamed protein product [Sphagnum tenellum]
MEGSLQHTFHERGECTGALRIAQETTQGYWGRNASGDLIFELVEVFLKAGTDVSSYSQQPSPRSFVYVRTRISTAAHRVSKQPGLCRGFSISA